MFETGELRALPLWGQVLVAARAAHRAALWLPADVPADVRDLLEGATIALTAWCRAGERTGAEKPLVELARSLRAEGDAAGEAFWWAADAAHAAESSTDFSAAERACESSVDRAMAEAERSPGMTGLQARITAAADIDLIGFACREGGIGRYDALGATVAERLHPVTGPDRRPGARHPMDGDPTGGAR
jgi:hypothetical protein